MKIYETPILFIVFNRPDSTNRVFDEIKSIKPRQLFIAADGPRNDNDKDKELCNKVRKIFSNIDWECKLHTLFRETNLGCKAAVSGSIDWFFSSVDCGIILEDDCLPDPTFFRFCQELLEHHKDNKNVMMISGGNFQKGIKRTKYSYYFSRYTHVWGWASWADRWRLYDVSMREWENLDKISFLQSHTENEKESNYWLRIFNSVARGEIDTWDYQLLFSNWFNNKFSIIPNVNLINNIGFDSSATHTKRRSPFSNMDTIPMNFPLSHPDSTTRNSAADKFTSKTQYRYSVFHRMIHFLKTFYKF